MSCIYFKFKSEKRFDSIVFDGPTCSLTELKRLVLQKKGLTKHPLDFDMIVSNAQTKQVYESSSDMIQRNSSVIIARIPACGSQPPLDSHKEEQCQQSALIKALADAAPNVLAEILEKKSSCESKLSGNAFWIKQADKRYNSTANQTSASDEMVIGASAIKEHGSYSGVARAPPIINGSVPHPSYVCHRCNRTGHFKHACPLLLESNAPHSTPSNAGTNGAVLAKRATGIPRSELIHLRNHVPGSYITSEGSYVIPRKEVEAILDSNSTVDFTQNKNHFNSAQTLAPKPTDESSPIVSSDLTCPLCNEIFVDAVLTPCCYDNFCDICIRTKLLESDDNECPSCHAKRVAADQIFANKFLRKCVEQYHTTLHRISERDLSDPDLDLALVAVTSEHGDVTKVSKGSSHDVEMSMHNEATSTNVVASNGYNPVISIVSPTLPIAVRPVLAPCIIPTTRLDTVLLNSLPGYSRYNQANSTLFANSNIGLCRHSPLNLSIFNQPGLDYEFPSQTLPIGFETDPKFQFAYVKMTLETLGILPLKQTTCSTG